MTDSTDERVGHTPGPWKACKNGHCSCGQIWGPDGNTSVARACGIKELTAFEADKVPCMEMQKANARLIAAAPALLEALIKLSNEVHGSLPLAEFDLRQMIGNSNYNILMQRAEEARAAIAKATGGAE